MSVLLKTDWVSFLSHHCDGQKTKSRDMLHQKTMKQGYLPTVFYIYFLLFHVVFASNKTGLGSLSYISMIKPNMNFLNRSGCCKYLEMQLSHAVNWLPLTKHFLEKSHLETFAQSAHLIHLHFHQHIEWVLDVSYEVEISWYCSKIMSKMVIDFHF